MTNPTLKKPTTTVRDLHTQLTATLAGAADPEVELRFPQKLRAAAAGAVFSACRPSFTDEDEGELGYILGQLAGWVLHGNAYDPDLDDDMIHTLKAAAA